MKIYKVGGCVRDLVLGVIPKDIDWVIVGASKEDIQKLIDEGYEQVGNHFPVFLHPVTREEYALARVERKTGIGYQGFECHTEGVTLLEDLGRRDLSINSMAMDPDTDEIIDPYGGRHDLERGILRHVSDAFSEDPLRVIRVARFAARYDMRAAPDTMFMMLEICQRGEIAHLSKDRIVKELLKLLSESKPYNGLLLLITLNAFEGFGENLLRGVSEVFEDHELMSKMTAEQKLALMMQPKESVITDDRPKTFKEATQIHEAEFGAWKQFIPNEIASLAKLLRVAPFYYTESVIHWLDPEKTYQFFRDTTLLNHLRNDTQLFQDYVNVFNALDPKDAGIFVKYTNSLRMLLKSVDWEHEAQKSKDAGTNIQQHMERVTIAVFGARIAQW